MKLIITLALLYFAYRLFFERPSGNIRGANPFRNIRNKPEPPPAPTTRDDEDYIDYEEVK